MHARWGRFVDRCVSGAMGALQLNSGKIIPLKLAAPLDFEGAFLQNHGLQDPWQFQEFIITSTFLVRRPTGFSMLRHLSLCALLGFGFLSASGCGGGADTSVVEAPSDEAALAAQRAAEEAYDKELAESNE